jgi:hypothetical protein
MEVIEPHGYGGEDDTRSAAIITLVLPKNYSHADVVKRLGASPGLLALEEI